MNYQRWIILIFLALVLVIFLLFSNSFFNSFSDKINHVFRENKDVPSECPTNCLPGKPNPVIQDNRDLPYKSPDLNIFYPDRPHPAYPPTAHVLWCEGLFQFSHFLTLLSIVKVVRPLKIVFHYQQLPQQDSYNDWFQRALQRFPHLVTRALPVGSCLQSAVTEKAVEAVLEQTPDDKSSTGGIYVGNTVLVTWYGPFPDPSPQATAYSFNRENSSHLPDMLVAHRPLSQGKHLADVIHPDHTRRCLTVTRTNFADLHLLTSDVSCVVLQDKFSPADFIELNTTFGKYVRWLFYGTEDIPSLEPSPSKRVPLIAHYVWLEQTDFALAHLLSVLSAIYVAGFQHVFVHSNVQPNGKYWDILAGRNVTLMRIQRPETVFQQKVTVFGHMSDLFRFQLLVQYGGGYADRDAFWVKKLDDSLLAYECVVSNDWTRQGNWPAIFNLGTVLAQRGSRYMKKVLDSYRDYRDKNWIFNAVDKPYHVYEEFPDLVRIDPHLQIICYLGVCHPTWEKNYIRGMDSQAVPLSFNWRTDVQTVHVTAPKPPDSMKSPTDLKTGKDMYAEIGRFILEQAGLEILGT